MVLTGDPGMGKTSLLQKLISEHGAEAFDRSRHRTRAMTLNISCPGFCFPRVEQKAT